MPNSVLSLALLFVLGMPVYADIQTPEQKVVVPAQVPLGELIRLSVSPIKVKPANLQSTTYTWKVYDGTTTKTVIEQDGVAWLGAGVQPKKLLAVVAVTHTFVDGGKVTVQTVMYDATVVIGDPSPDPGPAPPAPTPDTFPDGKFGLAKFSYDAAMSVQSTTRATEAKALGKALNAAANAIKAENLTDIVAILAKSHETNDAALGSAVSKWESFSEALSDRVGQLYSSRQVTTALDLAQAFSEIAVGLEKVK